MKDIVKAAAIALAQGFATALGTKLAERLMKTKDKEPKDE